MYNKIILILCLYCDNESYANRKLRKLKQQELKITQTENYYDQFYLPVTHKIRAASNTKSI